MTPLLAQLPTPDTHQVPVGSSTISELWTSWRSNKGLSSDANGLLAKETKVGLKEELQHVSHQTRNKRLNGVHLQPQRRRSNERAGQTWHK
jgi:hypothetical protein